MFHVTKNSFIHLCAGECLLENEEQNIWKKTVITLLFQLKALVIRNISDLDGEI